MKISFYDGWENAEKNVVEETPIQAAIARKKARKKLVLCATFTPMPDNMTRIGGICRTEQMAYGVCDGHGVSRDHVVKLGSTYYEVWVPREAE